VTEDSASGRNDDPPAAEAPLIDLSEGDLAAVASLWRKTGRSLRARFGGSSMEPAIPDGSMVSLRCGQAGARGDVIAFLAGGRLIVHRIVARAPDGGWTLTRGDARVLPDVPVRDPETVLGRVTGLCRGAAIEAVAPLPGSPLQRAVVRIFAALVRLSPGAGTAVLQAMHTALRWARTLRIQAGRAFPR